MTVITLPGSPTTGQIYAFQGRKWIYKSGVWMKLGDAGLIDISSRPFRATSGATASYNAGAIQDALSAAASTGTGIYIPPDGPRSYDTTLTMYDVLVPIYGAGKYQSMLSYTGAGVGLHIKPPTDGSSNVGHVLQDFSLWHTNNFSAPLSDSSQPPGGTYGIHVELRTSGACYYAYYNWSNISVGNFTTQSLYLNNENGSVYRNGAGFFDGVITNNCEFHGGCRFGWIGDSMVFEKSRVYGTQPFHWASIVGARSLYCADNLFVNRGSIFFWNTETLTFARNQCELTAEKDWISPYGYGGFFNVFAGSASTDRASQIDIYNNSFACYGTSKPTTTVLFTSNVGTTKNIDFSRNSTKIGASSHITATVGTDNISGSQNEWRDASDQETLTPSFSLGGTNFSVT